MPQLPPWIRPADTPAYYTRGLGLGLQAAQEQNRVNQAQQQMALEAQRAAVNQELARQELALREQETASERELAQAKIEEAGRRYSAQQQYQQRVAGGEDPMQVMMEMAPLMGSEQTVQAAIVRAQMEQDKKAQNVPFGPIQGVPVLDPSGQPIEDYFGVPSPTGKGGTIHQYKTKPGLTPNEMLNEAQRIQQKINNEEKKNPDVTSDVPDPRWKPDSPRLADWKAGRKKIVALQEQYDSLRNSALTGSLPSPAADFVYDPESGTLKKSTAQRAIGAGPSPASWGQSLWNAVRRGTPRAMPTNVPPGAVMLRPG